MLDEVELNEQRIADVEVPIFQLEQKVERLEQAFDNWNLNITEKMTAAVCAKIDQSPGLFLPRFGKSIEQLKHFQNEYETKVSLGLIGSGSRDGEGVDSEALKELKFMTQSGKRELDLVKNMFSPQKLKMINDLEG